uniref:Uncharacterized protein n=1 Tax=Candidatus Kentrum sp. FM TaxID=2126340 RepID=A0A450VPF3_9GAMM|nr:MAG: hypothetical protein BECKFM1743A_GA0114220_100245 [Candidatus Kentron sp. FM]VFK06657.1 MAG: hypothetical protein BECKFM1743B_GA0114221_1002213 [Candidatus Kentron sp. FM]
MPAIEFGLPPGKSHFGHTRDLSVRSCKKSPDRSEPPFIKILVTRGKAPHKK